MMKISRRRALSAGAWVLGASAAGALGMRARAQGAMAEGTAGESAPTPTPDLTATRILDAPRYLALRNLHTDERLEVEYHREGGYVPQALVALTTLLRDFRTGDTHPIDPALFDVLHAAARHLGVEPQFGVISGYRSPATNAMLHEASSGVASHSMHLEGRAIDVRLSGVDCAALASTGLSLARGGVGYYHRSDFVHLDTGRVRSWRG
jgi:uncharacterized protein YcbK (DUF882 family)